MNLTALKYFVEVAKEGSISRAANNMHVTQPTITRQLKLLEEEVGQSLYIRHAKGIELTKAGIILQERGREIIKIEQTALLEIIQHSDNLNGKIIIACVSGVFSDNVFKLVMGFHDTYPSIRICFRTGEMENLINLLKNNKADIVIGFYPEADSQVESIGIHPKLGLLMRSDDSIAINQTISYELLSELPLFAPKRSAIVNTLAKNGIDYDRLCVFAEYDEHINYMGFIRIGGKYALCLEPLEQIFINDNLCFRPLDPAITAKVGFKYKQDNENPITEAFISYYEKIKVIKGFR